MKKPKMQYTATALPFVLEAIGKAFSPEGFLIDKETNEFCLTSEGEIVHESELAGFENKLPIIKRQK